MSLSCGCDFDPSEHDDYYYHPDDFSEFNEYRRKRCTSCNKLINKGASIAEFKCFRKPKDDIEWRFRLLCPAYRYCLRVGFVMHLKGVYFENSPCIS